MAERRIKTQDEAPLLDVLIDGFEKNEASRGYRWRQLPMRDEQAARTKFAALVEEGRRWKGMPSSFELGDDRGVASWPDLELRQRGRAIMVLVVDPSCDGWWHRAETWAGDTMGPLFDWLQEDPPQRG